MIKRVGIIACFALALLAACTSQPIEKRKYTLHPVSKESASHGRPDVALGKIELAPYLRHEGIVIEVRSGQVRNAKHNLWAEPLSYSVRRYLQVQLRELLGAPVALHDMGDSDFTRTVDVLIHQLHGSESGTISIVASWVVRNNDNNAAIIESEFVATERLPVDGYAALVGEHKVLLNALAIEIAKALMD